MAFRSEADVDAWLDERGYSRGAVLDLETVWALSKGWYRQRLDADWRGRSVEEAQTVIEGVGLSGSFWALS